VKVSERFMFYLGVIALALILIFGCTRRHVEFDVFGQEFDFEHTHVDVDNDGDLDEVSTFEMENIGKVSSISLNDQPIFEDQLPGYIPEDC